MFLRSSQDRLPPALFRRCGQRPAENVVTVICAPHYEDQREARMSSKFSWLQRYFAIPDLDQSPRPRLQNGVASLFGQVRIGPGAAIGKSPGNWRRFTIATISMAGWRRPKSGVRSHPAAIFFPRPAQAIFLLDKAAQVD